MLLSICIPTHHGRAAKLERLLDQLIPQLLADDRIELCVSDNASRDATETVVARAATQIGARVRYHRYASNRGFTSNLLSSLELASGRWCWFLGSDDVVTPTAVADVAAIVERHPDAAGGTLYRTIADDFAGAWVWHDAITLLPQDPTREREEITEEAIVREMGQLQDFISTQVVDRELWRAVVAELGEPEIAARGLAYPHVLIIGHMVRRRPRWFWYPRETVRQHVGTTAVFAEETEFDPTKWEAHILHDRSEVWADLHGRNTALYRAPLTRTWYRHFEPVMLLTLKRNERTTPRSELRLLRVSVRAFWWLPRFWAQSFPVLVVPGAVWRRVYRLAHAARDFLRRRTGRRAY